MIRQDIQGWMEFINVDELKSRINSRNVFVWGAFIQGKYIRDWLEKNNIKVRGYIDTYNSGEYDGLTVTSASNITIDMYIIVAVKGIRNEIIDLLNSKEMIILKDYYYISHEYTVIPNYQYLDIYGNELSSRSSTNNVSISIQGYNSKIVIGKNVIINGKLQINLGSSSTIVLEDGIELNGNCYFTVNVNNLVVVRHQCEYMAMNQ